MKMTHNEIISLMKELTVAIDDAIIELQVVASKYPEYSQASQIRIAAAAIQCRISAMQLEGDTGEPSRIEGV